jgi:hypothetical protein
MAMHHRGKEKKEQLLTLIWPISLLAAKEGRKSHAAAGNGAKMLPSCVH